MANEIKLPEETLMKLGFKTLDLMYGELTIRKGENWDEDFIDKNGKIRLGYDALTRSTDGQIIYLYDDKNFFLSIIPVRWSDYERVLKVWFEERYKRKYERTDFYDSLS